MEASSTPTRTKRNSRTALATAALLAASLICFPASALAGDEGEIDAAFSYSPDLPATGQAITFTSESSADNPIVSQLWDLDDDGKFDDASGATATYAFSTPGFHRVRLRVRDNAGESDTAERQVFVDTPPNASFDYSPAAPAPGQEITLTSTSTDPDGTIARHRWDLNGNGDFNDGKNPTAKVTFATEGTYTVGLRVTDNSGVSSTTTRTITVATAPPPPPPPPPPSVPTTAPFDSGGVAGDKAAGLRFLRPFPIVRLAGRTTGGGAVITRFSVRAPRGSRIVVRCIGKRCPFGSVARKAAKPRKGKTRAVRFSKAERFFREGVVLTVSVTRKGYVGKHTRIRIRGTKAPLRWDRCLVPGSRKPQTCPKR